MLLRKLKNFTMVLALLAFLPSANAQLSALLPISDVVLASMDDISLLLPTAVNPDIVVGFVPVLGVLYDAPLELVGYIADGGVLVSPTLSILPSLPLVSSPIPLPGLGDTPVLDQLPIDTLSVDELVSQILGIVVNIVGTLPPIPVL
jgi:hypothetical protein